MDDLGELDRLNREAIAASHLVTARALVLVDGGESLPDVCRALGIDRTGWYQRLDQLAEWNAGRH